MRKRRRNFQAPTDPEQARRQRCNDAAWRFLLGAVAKRFPADGMREEAITELRRPRSLKALTGSAAYVIAEKFSLPETTAKLMPGMLADLLVLGSKPGPDGSPSPIAETYAKFTTWVIAKAGAERQRRDLEEAARIARDQWKRSREWEELAASSRLPIPKADPWP